MRWKGFAMAHESTTVTFRLPISEFQTLEQAAEAAGETVSIFVRKAVALRCKGGYQVQVLTNTSNSAPYTQTDLHRPTATNEAPHTVAPDEYWRKL